MQARGGQAVVLINVGAISGVPQNVQRLPERPDLAPACRGSDTLQSQTWLDTSSSIQGLPVESCGGGVALRCRGLFRCTYVVDSAADRPAEIFGVCGATGFYIYLRVSLESVVFAERPQAPRAGQRCERSVHGIATMAAHPREAHVVWRSIRPVHCRSCVVGPYLHQLSFGALFNKPIVDVVWPASLQ